ncbi:hypothetical protein DSO57_1026104 [Entomophthora muscae]|uniref:Uncharacterized protein n=1 Tax=Entomophthora muscae TaxID=34485 RepID=A0ACC2RT72_9FUNG|nr:hypothetical protein DSO57_1026104 [Entomophthora muscae]
MDKIPHGIPQEQQPAPTDTLLPQLLGPISQKASIQCSEIKDSMIKQLECLSASERQTVTNAWDLFSQSNSAQRDLMLSGILLNCSTSQLSHVSHFLKPLLKVDFIVKLPKELSLRILSFLDAKSLVQSSSVSKAWKLVANDDSLWRTLCDQHINKKCTKCGWGLPLLLDDYLKKKKADLKLTCQKRQREQSTEAPQTPEEASLVRASQRPKILEGLNFAGADPFGQVTPNEEPCDAMVPQSKSFWKHYLPRSLEHREKLASRKICEKID